MTRKKLLILLGSVVLALVMIAMACVGPAPTATPTPTPTPTPSPTPSPPPAAETITWRFQGYGGAEMDFWVQDFVERVDKMSDGRLKIAWYYGGSIVPNTEMLTAVSSGQLDGSFSCTNYWPSEVDVAILESALFGFNDLTQAYRVWYELGMLDLFREAYAEHNCYYLGPSFEGISLGGIDLMMNAPVYNLDDLRKLKVRGSALTAKVLGPLGVSTVYIPAQEMYTAAATGVIDATVYGSYVLNDEMGFAEVFKYYLTPSWNAPWCSCWFVNKDSFDALPEDLQMIVESAYYATNHYTCPILNQQRNVESIENLKDAGVTFTQLDDESWKALIASAMNVLDEEAAKSPRCAAAVEMIRQVKREAGLLD